MFIISDMLDCPIIMVAPALVEAIATGNIDVTSFCRRHFEY